MPLFVINYDSSLPCNRLAEDTNSRDTLSIQMQFIKRNDFSSKFMQLILNHF